MRQYQLWAWKDFYPSGAAGNFYGSYDSQDEARFVGERLQEQRVCDQFSISVYDPVLDEFVFVEGEPEGLTLGTYRSDGRFNGPPAL